MKQQLLAIAAAILSLAACTSDDDALSAYRNDPTAVRITAQVGSLATDGFGTRSYPIGTAEEQKKFKADDEISVKADAQDAVTYKYNGSEWVPQDGKYLKWESNTMTFTAYYPANFNGTVSQPAEYLDVEALEKADFMAFSGEQTNENGNQLSLTMERQMARVVVKIAGYNDQYDAAATTISSIKVKGVTAYYNAADEKYYALMAPCTKEDSEKFLELEVNNGGTTSTETLTGIPLLKAGNSYTYNLTVGKNKIQIAGVVVTDWTTEEIVGGKARFAPSVEGNVITMYNAGTLKAENIEEALGAGHTISIVGPLSGNDFATLNACLKNLGSTDGTTFDIDLSEVDASSISGLNDNACLGNVALPKKLQEVDENAFSGCANLHITNWNQLENLSVIRDSAFQNSGLTGDVVVLSGEDNTIYDNAFSGTGIKSVLSCSDLVGIGPGAFDQCQQLESVIFRGSGLNFYEGAQFSQCTSLKVISLENVENAPTITASDVFSGVNLSNVTLYVPTYVWGETDISSYFEGNGWTGFKEIKKGPVVVSPAEGQLTAEMITSAVANGHQFYVVGPMSVHDFYTLGECLYELGDAKGSDTLFDIDLSEVDATSVSNLDRNGYLGKVTLPTKLTSIGYGAFQFSGKAHITNWQQLTNLTNIGGYALAEGVLQGDEIELPNSVSNIEENAFKKSGIKSISLPDGVILNARVFRGCGSLEAITFRGGNVVFDGARHFNTCESLKTITFMNCTTAPENYNANDMFYDVTLSNITLYVPTGMTSAFQNAGWTGFKEIIEQ